MGNSTSRLSPTHGKSRQLQHRSRGFLRIRSLFQRKRRSQPPRGFELTQISPKVPEDGSLETSQEQSDVIQHPVRFDFLRLPKELRLMVYEEFISHEKKDFTLRDPDVLDLVITSVTPRPITPIHLTCKFIHAEAVQTMRIKLARKSAGYHAPRLILTTKEMPYPNMPDDAQVVNFLLLEDFGYTLPSIIPPASTERYSDFLKRFFNQADKRRVGRTCWEAASSMIAIIQAMERFAENLTCPHVSLLPHAPLGPGERTNCSWIQHAARILGEQHHTVVPLLDEATLYQDVVRLAERLAAQPEALATGISVYTTQNPKLNSLTSVLDDHHVLLSFLKVRLFVYTSWDSKGLEGLYGEWICFRGMMGRERWVEEWA